MGRRVILHVDMDAFFVSVELLRRPDLVGQPVVVGGTGRRGVVAAASYEARRFGVFSAMPSARARQLCPHAVFLSGDYEQYSVVSAEVREIFESVTPLVEPLSLDEAFLDVSGATRLYGDGAAIGHRIRRLVLDGTGLHCSVGVAPNKFLAKMASVEAKPRATPAGVEPGAQVFEVRPGAEASYLHPLPVRRLWGVGPSTYERLRGIGVTTIGDIMRVPSAGLRAAVGDGGAERLRALASGHDTRAVEVEHEAKSISHEETFEFDLHDPAELRSQIVRLADGVATRLRAEGLGARTLTLKVRDSTFTTFTRSRTMPSPVDEASQIVAVVAPLLDAITRRGGVRLLGVGASKFGEPSSQLVLDGLSADRPAGSTATGSGRTGRTVDRVRDRFGSAAIGPASALRPDGVRVVRRGARQWGPDAPAPGGEESG
ncbi:DNA polymerase IV [soil metagenome]